MLYNNPINQNNNMIFMCIFKWFNLCRMYFNKNDFIFKK